MVIMEGAQAQIVLAVLLQRDAGEFHLANQRDFAFQVVEFVIGHYRLNASPRWRISWIS